MVLPAEKKLEATLWPTHARPDIAPFWSRAVHLFVAPLLVWLYIIVRSSSSADHAADTSLPNCNWHNAGNHTECPALASPEFEEWKHILYILTAYLIYALQCNTRPFNQKNSQHHGDRLVQGATCQAALKAVFCLTEGPLRSGLDVKLTAPDIENLESTLICSPCTSPRLKSWFMTNTSDESSASCNVKPTQLSQMLPLIVIQLLKLQHPTWKRTPANSLWDTQWQISPDSELGAWIASTKIISLRPDFRRGPGMYWVPWGPITGQYQPRLKPFINANPLPQPLTSIYVSGKWPVLLLRLSSISTMPLYQEWTRFACAKSLSKVSKCDCIAQWIWWSQYCIPSFTVYCGLQSWNLYLPQQCNLHCSSPCRAGWYCLRWLCRNLNCKIDYSSSKFAMLL